MKMNVMNVSGMVAMKALKQAYKNSGLMMYYPNPTSEMYDEFKSVALLALVESGIEIDSDNNIDINMSDSEARKALCAPAYKAINDYTSAMRKTTTKSLYTTDIDENGHEFISNETVRLQRTTFEIARTLKENLTASEWKVLSYMTLGYTTEAIQDRMRYTTKLSTERKMRAVKQAAAKILNDEFGDGARMERAITSSRTLAKRRQKNGKAKRK